jgi:hypothetical protein
MKEIDLLICEWNDIPQHLRPNAIAAARDRAGRLAMAWDGYPDETTYVERGLEGASRPDVARWAARSPSVLRTDLRVCHFVDACVRAQASFHRRKAPPQSAKKLTEWVKRTRANRDACRDILLDLHCDTPPFNRAGPVERQALRKMMEAMKRENERAEMLLLALAFYPPKWLEKRKAPRGLEELTLETLAQPLLDEFGASIPRG